MGSQTRATGNYESCNEALSRICGAYQISCERWWELRGDIQPHRAGSLEFADVTLTGGVIVRDHRDQNYRGDQYFLICQVAGSARMRQRGSEAALQAGDCTPIDSRYPSVFEVGPGFRQLSFHLPAAQVLDRFGAGALPLAQVIPSSRGAGALLSQMLRATIQNAATLQGVELTTMTLDLLAAALCAGRGRAVHAPRWDRGDLSLQEVIHFIDARLHNPGLSPATIAGHFKTSVRRLYRVIGAEGMAPAALIWSRRLARARDLLENGSRNVPIIDIALSCGFKDGAHFSRAYRKAFGQPPKAARGLARTEAAA